MDRLWIICYFILQWLTSGGVLFSLCLVGQKREEKLRGKLVTPGPTNFFVPEESV